MPSDYVLWRWSPNVKWSIALSSLVNFPKPYLFSAGLPLRATFPPDVQLTMDPDHPRDLVPTDNLFNTDGLIVVSLRLKDFLQARPLKAVEYLPVAILDLKGKPLEERYFIVNPLDHVDCLDKEASQPTYDMIDEDVIDDVERLVLDSSRCDPERELFRIARFDRVLLASRALATAIDQAGFTSIAWAELEQHGS